MKKIKYSLLLPTFNKAKYLEQTIKSILATNYKNFELIISDDYSNDGTQELLARVKDKRVKILQPPTKLTQTKNYEFLLNQASGDWVTIIGDDDGILPLFFEKFDQLLEKYNDIQLIHTKPAIYYWEDVQDLYGPRVCDYQNFFNKPSIKDSKFSLLMALCGLKDRTKLPMIYTSGLVKMKLIKQIKSKSKNFFFHSVIPDYYSMIALLFETKKYLQVNEPLFWSGVSKFSTGRGMLIYDETKNNSKDYDFINKNLKLSNLISKKLHNIGLSSVYFFECILNHPYIGDFWRGNFIRYLVLSSSVINFNFLNKNLKFRIKNNISKKEFNEEIKKELKNYKLSFSVFLIIYRFLIFINFFHNILKLSIRFKNYILKKISNKNIVLVSKNRDKYNTFNICNNYIKNQIELSNKDEKK